MLIDPSAFSHLLKEDHLTYKSDIKVLDELSTAFSAGGPCAAVTYPQLEVLATCIFKWWMSIQAHELVMFPVSRMGQEEEFGQDGSPFEDTSKTHISDLRPQTSDPLDDANMSSGSTGLTGGDKGNEEMDQNPDEVGWDPLHPHATVGNQAGGDHALTNSILLMKD